MAHGRLYRRAPCRGSEEATGQYFWEVCASSVGRVYAACIPPLVLVMFKAQLPAPRLIARRLYSSRGWYLPVSVFSLLILTCNSDAIPLQLCERSGQVTNPRSSVTLQAGRANPEYVDITLPGNVCNDLIRSATTQSSIVGTLSPPRPSSRVRSPI